MSNKKLIIILMITVLFSAVANSQPVNLITDQFWDAGLVRELKSDRLFTVKNAVFSRVPFINSGSFRLEGKRINRIIIEADGTGNDRSALVEAVNSCGEGYIILSPLLSAAGGEIAGEYPEMIFILTGNGNTAWDDNTVKVEYDYKKAFYEAGVWAGTKNEKTYAAFFKDGKSYAGSETSFTNGWETVNGRTNLNIKSFNDTDLSDSDLLSGFETFFKDDKGLAAVFAGPYTETVVTGLREKPVSVVTIHAESWGSAGYPVAASIETGIISILTKIVNYISIDNYDDSISVEAEFFSYQDE